MIPSPIKGKMLITFFDRQLIIEQSAAIEPLVGLYMIRGDLFPGKAAA
jgi:hypothetical protein